MKKVLIFSTLLLLFTSVLAQKISYKKEQILLDGNPIANLEKISNGPLQPNNFSLKTLEGTEILLAKIRQLTTNNGYFNYDIVFVKSGNAAELSVAAISTGERLAKIFVENELIKDGQFNEAAEARFLTLFSSKSSPNAKETTENAENKHDNRKRVPLKYDIVKRPATGGIVFVDNNSGALKDGNSDVGYMQSKRNTADGKIVTLLTVTLIDGTTIAEGRFEGIETNNTATLTTFRDWQTHHISISETTFKKDIATYLIQKGYL